MEKHQEQMELNIALGKRMRALRMERGIKIVDLANETGLTSSTISQVERALISPSISTLKRICDALGIPVSYLFENADFPEERRPEAQPDPSGGMERLFSHMLSAFPPASPVVHKEERKILSPTKGVRFYLLNPDLSGPIELIYNEYDPGAGTGSELYSHPGVECGLILAGELVIQINDDTYVLKEGDSITFPCSEPHAKRNEGDVMCTCIWANCPPWF